MASVINTNVASLNAQRNLVNRQNALSTSIQRLSSGLRINSAKDDAAGLAISERFSSQIRGLNQAARNANDAISMTQTAEGAMATISDGLQRIRELSVQSANATNSTTDREAMQKEVSALVSEIGRIASSTEFNGTKLLDGSFSGQQMQIGANAGQTIGINSIMNAKTDSLGKATFQTATIDKAGIAAGTVSNSKYGYVEKAAQDITLNGVTISVGKMEASDPEAYATDAEAKAAGDKAYGAHLAAAINAKTSETNVIAEAQDDGSIKLTQIVGSEKITGGIKTGSESTVEKKVSDFDISTFGGAQMAMQIADKALEEVNNARADMGAIQNRFSSVIANLQSSTENLSASQSRIRDTDYASETAKLTRGQILQQAGTAMLAQANSLPNSVLSLLG